MTIADSPSNARKMMKLVREKRTQIAADNARLKDERNALRNKAERDPVEYEKQKADQKAAYAEMIAATEGRKVRAYAVVPGKTRSEHDQNARDRDAARKRDERKGAPQEAKDPRR